jgi:hypothetical protein
MILEGIGLVAAQIIGILICVKPSTMKFFEKRAGFRA